MNLCRSNLTSVAIVVLWGPKLVKQVLADLETTSSDRKFAAVRLNGLVHSDDKIALREIMRQLMLDQEMENASFVSGCSPR